MIMITMPATIASTSKYWATLLPIMLAEAPSRTKTVVNPNTKSTAEPITFLEVFVEGSSAVSSEKLTPAIYARYGGTIGSTQGETKEIKPAIKAEVKVTSSNLVFLSAIQKLACSQPFEYVIHQTYRNIRKILYIKIDEIKADWLRLMSKFYKLVFSRWIIALAIIIPLTTSVRAAELIMMEQDACPWCEQWHEEIGVIYNKTKEGKIAPLRVVNIHDEWPEDLKGIRIERFTPTFVLVENGKEIDRLRGYTGDEFFWFLIGEMIKKLPEETDSQG